jgi:hypothetical protein
MNRIGGNLKNIIALAMLCLAATVISCSNDTSSTPAPRTGTITQAELDKAAVVLDTGIIGDPFHGFGTDTVTTLHKMRDLFASIAKTTAVAEGDIFIRKAFYVKDAAMHKRDSILNFVVMVKRETGYYPAGGDWEYIKIPYNKTTDYTAHPYGLLPADTSTSTQADSTKTNLRGRLQVQCATCHSSSNNSSLLFTR